MTEKFKRWFRKHNGSDSKEEWRGQSFKENPDYDVPSYQVLYDIRELLEEIRKTEDKREKSINIGELYSIEKLKLMENHCLVMARFISTYYPELKMSDIWSSGLLDDFLKSKVSKGEVSE